MNMSTPKKIKSDAHLEEFLTNPFDIAESFNDFFANVGPDLAAKIPSTTDFKDYLEDNHPNSFYLSPITEHDIINEIHRLKPHKAMGHDYVHPKLVIDAANIISRPLEHIINCSLSQGKFPNPLKYAKITPVYKKGSALDVNNYRPISILPIFSKIVESIVKKQLISFLDKFDILLETQYGFRKKYNSKLALADLISTIADNMDEGFITFGVFIDLKKAFDTIDHDILLHKLTHYGIRGLPLQWFRSYLENRKQTVNIAGCTSRPRSVMCGVPQGSILGPILFLIYINDINKSTNAFNFRLYADDTNLFKFLKTNNINLNAINIDLIKVHEWCKANKLTISIEKTNYMIFKTPQKQIVIDGYLNLDGSPIEGVCAATYLGVTIDPSLTWKSHIDKIKKVISPKVGIISRIRHYVPRSILILLYNTLILPHLTYCVEIWGNAYPTLLSPLLRLQKRIVRLITFSEFYAHSAPLFRQLGILELNNLCKLHSCLFIFDLKHKHLAHDISHYFDQQLHRYPTKASSDGNLSIPKTNLSITQHNIKFSTVKHWNSLPAYLKNTHNRTHFKSTLKRYLLSI